MTEPGAQPATEASPEKLPPFVTIAITPQGLGLTTNVTDKLMVLALLEGAKFNLMQPERSTLVKPTNGMAGLMQKMRRA